jgi:hypothetical protein
MIRNKAGRESESCTLTKQTIGNPRQVLAEATVGSPLVAISILNLNAGALQ